MRNIFLEKLYTQCGGKASPIPFYKKSKSSIYPDQQLEFVFIECSSEDENVLQLMCLFLFYIKLF